MPGKKRNLRCELRNRLHVFLRTAFFADEMFYCIAKSTNRLLMLDGGTEDPDTDTLAD